MNVEFTGRNTTIYPKLRQLALTDLDRIEKILGGAVGAHVILTEDKYRMSAEITLNTKHDVLVGQCEDTDMVKALHCAMGRVEQQAVKHKERKITVERHAKPDSQEPLIEVISTQAAA